VRYLPVSKTPGKIPKRQGYLSSHFDTHKHRHCIQTDKHPSPGTTTSATPKELA